MAIAAAGGTPVAAAIGRLPDHHRDVIALVFVAGLPLADVAEVLGIPVGTVKSRLHHARAAVAAAAHRPGGVRMKELLAEYAAGSLDPADRDRVAAHLAGCAAAARTWPPGMGSRLAAAAGPVAAAPGDAPPVRTWC